MLWEMELKAVARSRQIAAVSLQTYQDKMQKKRLKCSSCSGDNFFI